MRLTLSLLFVATVLPLSGSSARGGPAEASFRGTVLDATGRPLAGARVWLRTRNGGCMIVPGRSYVATWTQRGGTFQLPTSDTELEVYVEHPGHAPGWAPATQDATVRLLDPAWIEGEVPDGCSVRVLRGVFPCATVEGGGTFRCGPLPPDEHLTLVVDSPRHRPLQQVLNLGEGETRPLVLRLDEGIALEGNLVPPQAGVEVRASQGEARESVALTDAAGAFRLTGLRAGAAQLVLLFADRPPLLVEGTAGTPLEVRWTP